VETADELGGGGLAGPAADAFVGCGRAREPPVPAGAVAADGV